MAKPTHRQTSSHDPFKGQALTLDDYLQRQRATAVLVLKDGVLMAERYNYARSPGMRMLSNSMAKTITALALIKALEEDFIGSFDDTAATYAPELTGSLKSGDASGNHLGAERDALFRGVVAQHGRW